MAIINLTVDKGFVLHSATVDLVVDETLRLAKKKIEAEIDLATVSLKRMQELNKKYRHVDRPTDVLSFSWQDSGKLKSGFLGEIIICLPYTAKQTKENKVSLKEELIRLIAHGTLHLVGFDHEKLKDEKVMFGIQEQVVQSTKH